jgi:hydroxymethylbilane synthase
MRKLLVAGTRGSTLARKQTHIVSELLQAAHSELEIDTQIIKTKGDHIQDIALAKIGGKGLFTNELEQSLLDGKIDFAVHSLKDLPVELPPDLTIGAYLQRETPNDVLMSKRNLPLREIPQNGVIATGSLRRKFQLLRYRDDFQIVDVRGNIETRIKKLYDNDWDGLILAYAALHRLGKTDLISEIISTDIMHPAVGQGIIAVECRDESDMHEIFSVINHSETETCAIAERAFLTGLGGGCQVPVGVASRIEHGQLHLSGVYMPEGGEYRQKTLSMEATKPEQAGQQLAEQILKE